MMVIVLIKWKIKNKQGQIDAFLKFWKKQAVVQDRRGLVGEFLTEAGSSVVSRIYMHKVVGFWREWIRRLRST